MGLKVVRPRVRLLDSREECVAVDRYGRSWVWLHLVGQCLPGNMAVPADVKMRRGVGAAPAAVSF